MDKATVEIICRALLAIVAVKNHIDGLDADSSRDLMAAIRNAHDSLQKAGLL